LQTAGVVVGVCASLYGSDSGHLVAGIAVRLAQRLLLVVAMPQPSPVPGLPNEAREQLVRADGEEALRAAAGALEGDVSG
jgi:hypothetical protein